MRLRALNEGPGGSCDWGLCDEEPVLERWADLVGLWLPVCDEHTRSPHLTLASAETEKGEDEP